MRYYIQPVVKRLGIKKRVTWRTFRRTYTTLLHANGEDVEGGAGVIATQLVTHHDGPVRASADARETGSTSESGGDGAVGETRAGGQNNLNAPQMSAKNREPKRRSTPRNKTSPSTLSGGKSRRRGTQAGFQLGTRSDIWLSHSNSCRLRP